MPRLKEDERNQAIGLLIAGWSISAVARHFNVCRATVRDLQNRWRTRGSTKDRPRTGRPRVTSHREDRFIRLTHLRDRLRTAQATADNFRGREGRRISNMTVLRRLREVSIRAYRPCQRSRLLSHHIRARLRWARAHIRWNSIQWRSVVFSDESRFLLERHDGRVRVYRRKGERFHACCIQEAANFGRGSVMVWGAMSANHRTSLIRIQGNLTSSRYVAEILQPHILPFMEQHGPGLVFMQDNAPAHRASSTQSFLNNAGINQLSPWPAHSPDMNPIEHAWDYLDRHVRALQHPPTTLNQLATCLIEAWNNIPQAFMRKLVRSMRRRCAAVVDARGRHTRY